MNVLTDSEARALATMGDAFGDPTRRALYRIARGRAPVGRRGRGHRRCAPDRGPGAPAASRRTRSAAGRCPARPGRRPAGQSLRRRGRAADGLSAASALRASRRPAGRRSERRGGQRGSGRSRRGGGRLDVRQGRGGAFSPPPGPRSWKDRAAGSGSRRPPPKAGSTRAAFGPRVVAGATVEICLRNCVFREVADRRPAPGVCPRPWDGARAVRSSSVLCPATELSRRRRRLLPAAAHALGERTGSAAPLRPHDGFTTRAAAALRPGIESPPRTCSSPGCPCTRRDRAPPRSACSGSGRPPCATPRPDSRVPDLNSDRIRSRTSRLP